MQELKPDPAVPELNPRSVTGTTVTAATDLALFNDNALLSVEGTTIQGLEYTLSAGNLPQSRAPLLTHTLGAPGAELALLDADRAAVATTAGLELVHLLATPTSAVLPGLDAAQGVVVSGGRVVVFVGSEVRVYALELNAF